MALFGKHLQPGVIGGVAATANGFSALPIDRLDFRLGAGALVQTAVS